MILRTVGIVGHGAFGTFVAVLLKRFAPQISVRFYSHTHQPDGETFFPLEDVAQSDVIILAVPIHVLEEMIKKIVPLMSKETIMVDVSTVKKYPVSLLKKYAKGRKYIATHPMFGPESYEKKVGDVGGFRIVVTDSTLSNIDVAAACKLLELLGFTTLRMTADAHDKHLAQTLFLTHFIGQIVSHAKFDRTEIDTVSFGYLMDAVESVKHDKKLFQDVYRYNPHCKKILKKFAVSEREVQRLLAK